MRAFVPAFVRVRFCSGACVLQSSVQKCAVKGIINSSCTCDTGSFCVLLVGLLLVRTLLVDNVAR